MIHGNLLTETAGIGQSGPLTLLVALVQFTSPHAYLSTATGLAFSARAIGGAFGSAVLDSIINSKLRSSYAPAVSGAAIKAGLLYWQLLRPGLDSQTSLALRRPFWEPRHRRVKRLMPPPTDWLGHQSFHL